METLTIFNLSDRPRTFDLPHQQVCVKIGRCLCNPNGTPAAIILPARRSPNQGIPGYVLLAERFKAAVDAGELRIFTEHAAGAKGTAGTAKNTSNKPRKKTRASKALKE
jgi:hypothetical protein